MRYLIAGSHGMLGTALQRVLADRDVRFSAPGEKEFDITHAAMVDGVVKGFAASLESDEGVLVNAAAYTNVERAEDEPEAAWRVNEEGARLLAEACERYNLRFVHVSTDFVFDGTKEGAYTEEDEPNPLSVYGESKLAGEYAVREACPEALLVRTAWVFGPGGANFPSKILTVARERRELSVVTDERGSPTYTVDLATGIVGLVSVGAHGLFHLAGLGACTRFELARTVLDCAEARASLTPTTSAAYATKARRPANSELNCSKAVARGVEMPPWKDGIARYVADLDAGY